MTDHAGIKFIRDYEKGKYGGAIKGELKAFMYSRMIELESEMDVHRCYSKFDLGMLVDVARHAIPGLYYCWISQKGMIYYCDVGAHDIVCRDVFGEDEKDFEQNHAKISVTGQYGYEPMDYVRRPSKLMRLAVEDVIKKSQAPTESEAEDIVGHYIMKSKRLKDDKKPHDPVPVDLMDLIKLHKFLK